MMDWLLPVQIAGLFSLLCPHASSRIVCRCVAYTTQRTPPALAGTSQTSGVKSARVSAITSATTSRTITSSLSVSGSLNQTEAPRCVGVTRSRQRSGSDPILTRTSAVMNRLPLERTICHGSRLNRRTDPFLENQPVVYGKRVGSFGCSNVSPLAMDRPFQDPAVDPVLCSPYDPRPRSPQRIALDN